MANTDHKRFKDDINLLKSGRSFYLTLIICLVVFFGATGLLITAVNRLITRHDEQLSAEIIRWYFKYAVSHFYQRICH